MANKQDLEKDNKERREKDKRTNERLRDGHLDFIANLTFYDFFSVEKDFKIYGSLHFSSNVDLS